MTLRPTGELGVYVHFPYCRARCPYCDFKVDVARSIPGDRYRDAVLDELRGRLTPALAQRRLRSLYFGGGTPSLWAPGSIGAVIEAVTHVFGVLAETIEITVEANPRELDAERVAGLEKAGVNRLSIGTQSFDDPTLHRLGRDHDAAAARRALDAASASSIPRHSFDLIATMPGRDLDDWRRELTAAEPYLSAGHVSVYELTIHAGTHFGRLQRAGRLRLPDDEIAEAVLLETEAFMAAHGLRHYEVSNYASPGLEAVHNGLYWSGAEYLGLGVGAHSMVVAAGDGGGVVRRENTRDTARYLDEPLSPPAAQERLTAERHLRERVFLGLRTARGLDLAALSEQLGASVPEDVRAGLERCRQRGWVEAEGERWRPTALGLRLADAVALEVV